MKTIIVGGGKVGFYLAKSLIEHDYDTVVVERNDALCQYCANNLNAEIIHGDGTDYETLKAAGAQDADAVIAVMGQDQNNLVCCQIAKKIFGVNKVIAKVNNPKNTDALKTLGIDIVISATDNIIKLLEHEVDVSAIKELLPLNDSEAALLEITLPEKYAREGVQLRDLDLPADCNIACISRGKKTIIPRGLTGLHGGDVLLVVALCSEEKELRRVLKVKD